MCINVVHTLYLSCAYSLFAGGAYQKCGVPDLLLGRANRPKSEEDL